MNFHVVFYAKEGIEPSTPGIFIGCSIGLQKNFLFFLFLEPFLPFKFYLNFLLYVLYEMIIYILLLFMNPDSLFSSDSFLSLL